MKGRRPAWLMRFGLFLYDHIGGRKILPATKLVDLTTDESGKPLKDVFVNAFGVTQPAPSPRFSRTPGDIRRAPPAPGAHTEEVLKEWDVR